MVGFYNGEISGGGFLGSALWLLSTRSTMVVVSCGGCFFFFLLGGCCWWVWCRGVRGVVLGHF